MTDRGQRFETLVRAIYVAIGLAILVAPVASSAAGPETSSSVEARVRELEHNYSRLLDENRRLNTAIEELQQSPAVGSHHDSHAETSEPKSYSTQFHAGYDDGFLIAPVDRDDSPFTLKVNSENMFRYTAFARDVRTWTDSAGNVNPVTDRSNFELPRGRLIFSGTAWLPEFNYYINIDYNTVTSDPIGFRGYWLGYKFDHAFELYVGQNKVPGTREWLTSSFGALGPDRSLATTFFRPSLSQGIWAIGEPSEGQHYHVMLSNGFNTSNVQPDQLDNRMCWSGSFWSEPWGDFGATYSDLECHEESAIRYGLSLTYSAEQGQQGDPDSPENASIRLSDGTVITNTGAFAPGATLQEYQLALAAFDLGWKRRGWSISGELYLQELFDLQADAPLPANSTFAFGGFAQIGWFAIQQELEFYARTSHVKGEYGTGGEYAGGFNWFILPGKNSVKFTSDVAWINRSPADQNRTDYRAGDTGLLLRTQIQTTF